MRLIAAYGALPAAPPGPKTMLRVFVLLEDCPVGAHQVEARLLAPTGEAFNAPPTITEFGRQIASPEFTFQSGAVGFSAGRYTVVVGVEEDTHASGQFEVD